MSHFEGLNGKLCSRTPYPTAPTGLIDAQIGEHAFAGRRRKGPEDAERVRIEGAARDGDAPASSLKGWVYALSRASAGDGDCFAIIIYTPTAGARLAGY
jgi:hypothetical protein